jgi:hypothetical protein
MKTAAPCIAVSGLHRGENPQPGASIIRSLRRRFPDAHIVGLSYDVMESGIYAEGGPDEVHLMPCPAAGGAALLDRIDAIRKRTVFDLFIPTLDAEIEVFVSLHRELDQRGIGVCLPSVEVLERRAKQHLPALAAACDLRVPETRLASDIGSACQAGSELGYPLVVKGPYYDAKIVHNSAQLSAAASHLLSEWGHPVILQRLISGSEFNVLGLGDGAAAGWPLLHPQNPVKRQGQRPLGNHRRRCAFIEPLRPAHSRIEMARPLRNRTDPRGIERRIRPYRDQSPLSGLDRFSLHARRELRRVSHRHASVLIACPSPCPIARRALSISVTKSK